MSGPDLGGDQGNTPAPTPQPAPAPAPERPAGQTAAAAGEAASAAASAAVSAMEGMFKSFTLAEQLMVGGALLVVAADLLLGALLGGGGAFVAVVLAAAELVLAVWLKNRRDIVWPASYGLILSALVTTVAVLELEDFLAWIHQLTQPGGTVGGGIGLLTALCQWVGAVLMSWGAITYWRSGGK